MVSRRNYLTVAIMMLILFFMFQFTGVMKNQLNEYGVNEYDQSTYTHLNAENTFSDIVSGSSASADVFYVGAVSGDVAKVVSSWCEYSKRTLQTYQTLSACETVPENQLIILDGLTTVRTDADILILQEWMDKGVNIIFARMPDVSVIQKSAQLEQMLGINRIVSTNVTLNGMHLFSGFFLGGERIYEAQTKEDEKRQDLDHDIPWYVTGAGTKTYLVGTLTDEVFDQTVPRSLLEEFSNMEKTSVKNNLLPAVIWRYGTTNSKVFCVNDDFLTDVSGIGILSAMTAQISDYEIYPVVNAQNLVAADMPAFSSENEEKMQELYAQSASAVYREIIWPSLVALQETTGAKLTCMVSPQFTYDDEQEPDGSEVTYYLKQLKEQDGELGWSATNRSNLSVSEKLTLDKPFWKDYGADYKITSIYLRDGSRKADAVQALKNEDVRTVVVSDDDSTSPIISYEGENITQQKVTSAGITHTFSDDLKLRSMETALGYSNITLDLLSVTYPETEQDSWEKMLRKLSPNLTTFWKPFEAFTHTTLSESDQRIRRFLAIDYEQERQDDNITVRVKNFDQQAWFVLRLNGETVKSVKGGTSTKIEDGAYLICAEKDEITIKVGRKSGMYYGSGQKSGEQE